MSSYISTCPSPEPAVYIRLLLSYIRWDIQLSLVLLSHLLTNESMRNVLIIIRGSNKSNKTAALHVTHRFIGQMIRAVSAADPMKCLIDN